MAGSEYRIAMLVLDDLMHETAHLIVFAIDDRRFALPLDVVDRVFPVGEITQVPGAPANVLGIICLQGQAITVLNLRAQLGLPNRDLELSDRLIVTRVSNRPAALWVDAVELVRGEALSQDLMEDLLPGVETVQRVQVRNMGLVLICDLERWLSLEAAVPVAGAEMAGGAAA